jgi:hypothetical protein
MANTEHNESPLSERVLATIQEEHVEPKPRWYFLLREWVVWVVALVALVLGSIATALTLYIRDASRFIERQVELSNLASVFHAIPAIWVVLFAVGVFYTVYALRETKRGYKWNPLWLVMGALALSIGLGASAFAMGAGEPIDRYLISNAPMYKPLSGYRPEMWMHQDAGVVAGIVEETNEESFLVRTIHGELLEVATTPETALELIDDVHPGMRVRVVGTTTTQGHATSSHEVFEAENVAPFKGRGGMQRKGEGGGPRQELFMREQQSGVLPGFQGGRGERK